MLPHSYKNTCITYIMSRYSHLPEEKRQLLVRAFYKMNTRELAILAFEDKKPQKELNKP